MQVYHHIDDFVHNGPTAVSIGSFDGIHRGHQKVLTRLKEVALSDRLETVILTFFPHPRMIIRPEETALKMLSTVQEKIELIAKAGIDHLIITPFTRDFSNLHPREYIEHILVKRMGVQRIMVGHNHRFGKNRAGEVNDLRRYALTYGFNVDEIPLWEHQHVNGLAVSSTKIRNFLLGGEVETANLFLGYPFYLTGKVIRGDQLGRELGFPTANILIEETYKLIPADGIYASTAEILGLARSKVIQGMSYVGRRPTINGMDRHVEVHLFDVDENIYEQSIRLYFHNFIREDRLFNTLEELRIQMEKDEKVVRTYFKTTSFNT